MATIGKLVAVLTAKTQPFVRGLGKARKVSLSFAKSVARVGLQLVKMGAIAATAVVAGIALMVRSQFKAIDALAKLSKNLGITVDSLQALRLAASIGGLEISKFDKALKKLAKAVNDASLGLTTYSRAFEALGINAMDLTRLKVDEIFKRIADAVEGTTVSVKLLGSIMDIFGARVGADLIEVLRQGRAGIEAFEREVRELGLSLSRIDASQVELARDAMTRLSSVMRGIAQRISVELAPFVTILTRRFIAWGKTGVNMGDLVSKAIGETTKSVFNLGASLAKSINFIRDMRLVVLELQLAMAKLLKFTTGFEFKSARIEQLVRELAKAQKTFVAREAAERGRRGAFERFQREIEKIREEARKLSEETFPSLIPLVEETEDAAKKFKQIIESTRPAFGLPDRQGQFRQVRLSRTALGKVASGVTDNSQLDVISRQLGNLIRELRKEPLPVEIAFD